MHTFHTRSALGRWVLSALYENMYSSSARCSCQTIRKSSDSNNFRYPPPSGSSCNEGRTTGHTRKSDRTGCWGLRGSIHGTWSPCVVTSTRKLDSICKHMVGNAIFLYQSMNQSFMPRRSCRCRRLSRYHRRRCLKKH